MEEPENTGAPAEIGARRCHGPVEDAEESKLAWEAFFAAIEGQGGGGCADNFIGEEAA